ncbi:MAG: DUF4249 domain-containing protein [Siphonobacter aquaeclarae]|nr:DUF4249 domain-containing protein [Siphonobacter aquaeclarae]
MKRLILFLFAVAGLTSCQEVINLKTETGPIRLVVDGWITDQPGAQRVRLTLSQNYFNNTAAKPATGATVSVTDDLGKVYPFVDEKGDGNYYWRPAGSEKIGRLGGKYTLKVGYANESYEALTEIKRVPPLDSITYYYDKPTIAPDKGPKEGYVAEFFGRDLTGAGDCYWVKTFKNSVRYDNSGLDITTAYDAGFSAGAATDGLIFIRPIRQSINVNKLFSEKDTIRVELYSINQAAFYFLNAIKAEAGNQGLFATAPANVQTNLNNVRADGPRALGWFGASAISKFTTVVRKEEARPKP